MITNLIPKTPQRINKKQKKSLETTEEDFLSDEDCDIEELVPQPSTSKTSQKNLDMSKDRLKVGDFIIVKFPTDKRDRHFIGKIEK